MTRRRDTRGSAGGASEEPNEGGESFGPDRHARPDRGAVPVVLVVSESAEIRETLTHYLIRQDLIAMPAHNGAQALAVCETVLPHAVLVDVALPDLERLALIGHVKAQRPRSALVVVFSDSAGEDREAQRRANDADYVLPKPIELEALGRILAGWPARHPESSSPADLPAAPPTSDPTGD